MKRELPLRITLVNTPTGVAFCLQEGRSGLVPPTRVEGAEISFDVKVRVSNRRDGQPNLLGPSTQGPPGDRFLYVSSGALAGQAHSCWTRRAKVSLTSITWPVIEHVQERPGSVLEARIQGTAADGGPACARVGLLSGGWTVVLPG